VIGGTSLFGGRGNIRSAVLGAAVISTISNGLFIFAFSPGVIYITTGCILLFAVTLDTIARRRQAKTGASFPRVTVRIRFVRTCASRVVLRRASAR